jgi:hypothetical protein
MPAGVVSGALKASALRVALAGWVLSRDAFGDEYQRDGWTVYFDRLQDRVEVTGPRTSLLWGGVDPAAVPVLVAAIGGPVTQLDRVREVA